MRAWSWLVIVVLLAACKGDRKSAYIGDDDDRGRRGRGGRDQAAPATVALEPAPEEDEAGGTGYAMALEEGKMGKKDLDRAEGQYKMRSQAAAKEATKAGILGNLADNETPADAPASPPPGGAKGRPEGVTRAWFPETFLFDPLVVTDASGKGEVRVRVPDRLTSWRVLALAHARNGAQGGALARFLGTLPTYVDLVVPDTLVQGDEVRLPVQLVNTSETAVTAALELRASNATLVGGGGGNRTIPAQGSLVEYVRLRADKVGTVTLEVALRGSDALVRTLEVEPAGKPVTTTRTGTLAAPRTLTIEGPANSNPATDRVRLLVFPGALSLLRAELGVCTARSGLADDAYALLLGGQAPSLLQALGDQADPDALRSLSILTTQRAVRHGRSLDVERATLLTEAALAHPASPVLQRLGERAASYLAQHQRPDGTFGGGDGWTLQRLLVATADATRAVKAAAITPEGRQRAIAVSLKASGAFERNLGNIEDGYTSAAILASGAVSGALVDTLRDKVKAGLEATGDGAKRLVVGPGVVRADGVRPTTAEATALAVLALTGDPTAPLPDLGATLLGSYDPVHGWGDGRANLVAMRAVIELFKTPVPAGVKISLTMDGVPITSGTLDRDKLKSVLVLEAPAAAMAGGHTWNLVAEPPVPGLGYSLTLEAWVPWERATGATDGLELALPPTITATAGRATDVQLRAIAPSGTELHVHHALPAGVQVDTPSLEALVRGGVITRFEVSTGAVDLYVDALEPGQTFAATYKVIPTLAGTLQSPPSQIAAAGVTVDVPPVIWTIK
jgi:hypothetical protein